MYTHILIKDTYTYMTHILICILSLIITLNMAERRFIKTRFSTTRSNSSFNHFTILRKNCSDEQ